jgi:pseudaminic acid synthase
MQTDRKMIKKTPALIVAELSANHGNDLSLALKTVDAFASAGADAIKVQTFRPESLCMNINNDYFGARKKGLWKGRTLWDIYSEGALPYDWHWEIQKACEKRAIEFFSSPFDLDAVDFLSAMHIPRYKIASMEINDLPLIRKAASQGKPIIISTGLGDVQDIEKAVEACFKVGNYDVTLLKCTSSYPATLSEANLLTIPDMEKRFGVAVGVSDHTLGFIVPVTSVALGATFIEKHVVLDKTQKTLDAEFSMDPAEFSEMVKRVREAEEALGTVAYEVSDENKLRRRSLFTSVNIIRGEIVSESCFRSVRPGNGAAPDSIGQFVGKRAKHDIHIGNPANLDDFE